MDRGDLALIRHAGRGSAAAGGDQAFAAGLAWRFRYSVALQSNQRAAYAMDDQADAETATAHRVGDMWVRFRSEKLGRPCLSEDQPCSARENICFWVKPTHTSPPHF